MSDGWITTPGPVEPVEGSESPQESPESIPTADESPDPITPPVDASEAATETADYDLMTQLRTMWPTANWELR